MAVSDIKGLGVVGAMKMAEARCCGAINGKTI